jgi:hypothetical protein
MKIGERLEDFVVDERIVFKGILDKLMRRHGLDSSGSGYGPVAGSCEHGYER